MSAPTQLSEDDAKKDYLALCLKMTHAQLYAELMRVHKEATLLVQQAAEQEREECAKLALQGTGEPVQLSTLKILKAERERICKSILDRGDHGNNT